MSVNGSIFQSDIYFIPRLIYFQSSGFTFFNLFLFRLSVFESLLFSEFLNQTMDFISFSFIAQSEHQIKTFCKLYFLHSMRRVI